MKLGVLGLHVSKETKAILNAAEEMGFGTEWLRRENIVVTVEDGEFAFEPDVDVVVNRLLLSTSTSPAEDLGLARIFDAVRPTLNDPDAVSTATHKFAAAAVLAENDVAVPDAVLALSNANLNAYRDRFGKRAVYKTAIGTHGGGAWQVELDEPVNPQVGSRQAFLQSFVERSDEDVRDVRVYVVGDEAVASMYRYAPEGDWRTNVSLGGDVEDASDDLPPEAVEIALDATEAVGLDYAGVDLVHDGSRWFVLEVNPTAGFRGLFEATGTSPAPYIVRLAAEEVGVDVGDGVVERLSRSLDDGRPACTPSEREDEPGEPRVLGFVEEVVVSGTRGSETVFAKSDTGAKRTSVDSDLAAEIGSGPIKDVVKVRSGSSKTGKSRPLVDVVVGVGGTQHTVTASVEDRSHMNYPLLLGRDILQHYNVDVRRRVDASNAELEE